jgi:DNA primase catalytic subunit
MRVKVKKIRNYYNSIKETDLWLPVKPAWRQYRFFVWDDKQERVVVRIIKDNIRDKATLLRWLKRLAPIHVYYTTAAWMNPQGIGPDPFGKKGRNKFRKKGWSYKTKTYHNNFLWQELYFDVDYCNADYNEGAKTLGSLINELDKEPNLFSPREELTIVFSGGKGFHLVDTNWRTMDLIYNDEHDIGLFPMNMSQDDNKIQHLKNIGYDIAKPEDRQRFSRFIKQKIVDNIKDEGILIDYDVTPDPRRIIRLPGTVHGKTLRVCKIITENDLLRNEAGEIVGYEPDEPIG